MHIRSHNMFRLIWSSPDVPIAVWQKLLCLRYRSCRLSECGPVYALVDPRTMCPSCCAPWWLKDFLIIIQLIAGWGIKILRDASEVCKHRQQHLADRIVIAQTLMASEITHIILSDWPKSLSTSAKRTVNYLTYVITDVWIQSYGRPRSL
jgi:hypothetical protein